MFKNLRTSTKLLLLCGVFVGALVVATYSLVAEKQIAIQFVRKELVGVQHLELLRGVYAALLKENLAAPPGASRGSAAREELDKLAAAHKADSERWTRKRSNARSARRSTSSIRPGTTTSSGPPSSRRLTRRATSHRGSATTPTSRSIRTLIASTSRTSSSPKCLLSSARLESSSLSSTRLPPRKRRPRPLPCVVWCWMGRSGRPSKG